MSVNYRYLNPSEIIQKGDQILVMLFGTQDQIWEDVWSVTCGVFVGGSKVRRPIKEEIIL